MTRQEKIDYILHELSLGENDNVPQDLVEMVESKSDRSLGILVNQIQCEKDWLHSVGEIAS